MAERTSILSAPRSLPAAASLFSMRAQGVGWDDKLVAKDVVAGKSATGCMLEEEDNNQDDEGPQEVDDENLQEDSPRIESDDEIHRLRNENITFAQRLALMETQHAQDIGDLETKLQHAIQTHKEIEQRLRTQLRTVLREQQEAVENARKVRGVLTRVSMWVRQIQRAAHAQRPPTRTRGASQAYPTTERSKATMAQDNTPESIDIQVNSISEAIESLPPPAPGRNRGKGEPGKGFTYVRPAEVVLKPLGGQSFVLDGLPSVPDAPRRDPPIRKRSAGDLLAYCAQVVTTSLAGVRSSPSPTRTKVTPAWKLIGLHPVREEIDIDEEAGQCSQPIDHDQRLNVSLPNLSLGLL